MVFRVFFFLFVVGTAEFIVIVSEIIVLWRGNVFTTDIVVETTIFVIALFVKIKSLLVKKISIW
jgi:hypothetical protein